jgi:hypothetical protein
MITPQLEGYLKDTLASLGQQNLNARFFSTNVELSDSGSGFYVGLRISVNPNGASCAEERIRHGQFGYCSPADLERGVGEFLEGKRQMSRV